MNSTSPTGFSPVVLRAVSYLRVSTSRQSTGGTGGDGYSLPAQRDANRRHAHTLGALVVAEFVEHGRSGTTTDRPALQRLLTYLHDHPVDFVIVHKIDRLARNRTDDANLTHTIHATGARLVSSTEAIDSTPGGRLLHGIMASIAEFYSQNLATEVNKGMQQKVLQGGSVNRAPLGYLNARTTTDGVEQRIVTLDPARAEHITWAFRTYATGAISITQLATALNERGLTTRATASRTASPVTTRTVHHLLKNSYYAGIVTLNGVEHPGTHEPLVDAATWATVQEMLAARRTGQRSRVHNHYLKGTVHCITCGCRLIIQNTTSKSGRVYQYFICSRRRENPCPQRRALPVPDVEQRIEDAYAHVNLDPSQQARIEEITLHPLRHQQEHLATRRDALLDEASKNTTRQERLAEFATEDLLPRERLTHQRERFAAEEHRIRHELNALDASSAELEQQIRDALDLLKSTHATYLQADEQTRQRLNQALFREILLGPEPDQIRLVYADSADSPVDN